MSQNNAGAGIRDMLTDHSYDGIQEYDNPMPGWWVYLFIATIAFSAVYFVVMTLTGDELGPRGFYARAVAEDEKRQFGMLGELAQDAPTLLKFAHDPKWLRVGAAIYVSNCASCHGREAEGVSAPNLTDNNYIYVRQPADFYDVINKGRKNGAMPSWENRLKPSEVVLVASYVASLRGLNKPGRAPEGDPIDPWPESSGGGTQSSQAGPNDSSTGVAGARKSADASARSDSSARAY